MGREPGKKKEENRDEMRIERLRERGRVEEGEEDPLQRKFTRDGETHGLTRESVYFFEGYRVDLVVDLRVARREWESQRKTERDEREAT